MTHALAEQWPIVVGVDGSPSSQRAVEWAATEARMRNVGLKLVHAVPTMYVNTANLAWAAAPLPEEYFKGLEQEAQRALTEAVAAAEAAAGPGRALRIDTAMLEGALVPELIEQSRQARMMVVGCRGLGAFSRAVLGSVSTGLVNHAHCPVAVIHDEMPAQHPDRRPVVVGIDGSTASELATKIAFEAASFHGVELVAVHAYCDADYPVLPAHELTSLLTAAEETLAERLCGWQERYPDVSVRRVVVWQYPVRALVAEADSAQLVVVGSRGRGGFAGLLLGSVSSGVLHGSRTPVIVARRR